MWKLFFFYAHIAYNSLCHPGRDAAVLAVINVTCCCTCVRSHQQPADRFFASRAPKQKKTGLMKYAFPLLHSHCSTVYTVRSSHLFVSSHRFLWVVLFFPLGLFLACLKPDRIVFNKEFLDVIVARTHCNRFLCKSYKPPRKLVIYK